MSKTKLSLKEAAIDYASKGLFIFPLAPRRKTPLLTGSWKEHATNDPNEADRLWSANPDANIAIRTWGKDSRNPLPICVLDVDVGHDNGNNGLYTLEELEEIYGESVPSTPLVRTPSGGFHHYFLSNGCDLKNKAGWAPGLDSRSEGGYVVAPPSVIYDDGGALVGEYSWHNGNDLDVFLHDKPDGEIVNEIPVVPTWLSAESYKKSSVGGNGSHLEVPEIGENTLLEFPMEEKIQRARAYISSIPGAVQGQHGDEDTYRVACKALRDFALPWDDALNVLREWNQTCNPPWNEEDLIVKLRNAYQYGTAPLGAKLIAGEKSVVGDAALRKYQPMEQLTDVGNAKRFATKFRGKVLYCPQTKNWYVWNGKVWEEDWSKQVLQMAMSISAQIRAEAFAVPMDKNTSEPSDVDQHNQKVRKELLNWARQSESLYRIRAVVELAQVQPGLTIHIDQLDSHPELVNLNNGTFNVKTQNLEAHDPKNFLTRIIPIEWNPEGRCPKWERYLLEVMDGDQEMVEFLQVAGGYSLTGLTREDTFFMLYGNGKNGKSVFLDTMEAILGDYASNCEIQTLMRNTNENRTISNDLAGLRGSRFVCASENNQGAQLDEGKVKHMTGGSKIACRFLHKEFFSYRPDYKIWFSTNHKPRIRGTDDGIWRRIRPIPFERQFKGKKANKNLREELLHEKEGILNFLIQGLLRYLREDGLPMPKRVNDALLEYRTHEDALASFVDECLSIGGDTEIEGKSLYKIYRDWATDNGYSQPLTHPHFTSLMTERSKRMGFSRIKGRGGQTKWRGISATSLPVSEDEGELR